MSLASVSLLNGRSRTGVLGETGVGDAGETGEQEARVGSIRHSGVAIISPGDTLTRLAERDLDLRLFFFLCRFLSCLRFSLLLRHFESSSTERIMGGGVPSLWISPASGADRSSELTSEYSTRGLVAGALSTLETRLLCDFLPSRRLPLRCLRCLLSRERSILEPRSIVRWSTSAKSKMKHQN
jgi:hypothetical protein